MGTRSITRIREEENGPDFVLLYRQFDGYPTGIGAELHTFLKPFTVVNGIGFGDDACAECGVQRYLHRDNPLIDHAYKSKPIANGMGCLAAQVVKHFKESIGNVYLEPPNTDHMEAFNYFIWFQRDNDSEVRLSGDLMLKVISHDKLLYRGVLADFDPEAAANFESEAPEA